MLSFLDNDLYKLTMQQAVRRYFPRASVSYRLVDRSNLPLPADFAYRLDAYIREWSKRTITGEELKWLEQTGFFEPDYLSYLAHYQFDCDELDIGVTREGALDLRIHGSWQSTILWEVPLLASINELFYEQAVSTWNEPSSVESYYGHIREKANRLLEHGCIFGEFGTRRRRSDAHHEVALEACRDAHVAHLDQGWEGFGSFRGTSNLHFARCLQLRPIGTMAHEWVMAHTVFSDLETANRDALLRWMQLYGDRATTALTDTYTTALFFENFERVLAEAFTTIRHDSGNPFLFIDKALAFYRAMGIDAKDKTILFSDHVDVEEALDIRRYLGSRANAAFAIGTDLTNDLEGSEKLDLEIKLETLNGHSVCQLTDDRQKAIGPDYLVDAIAQRVENHTRTSPHHPSW